jgi:hypothetical protein
MSRFEEITAEMGLLQTYTYNNSNAEGGSIETYYTVSNLATPVSQPDTSDINKFVTTDTREGDDNVVVVGDGDFGFDYSTQEVREEQEAIFNPSLAIGRDGAYVANINAANTTRAVAAQTIAFDSDGNGSLTESGGDPDYLRTSELAFADKIANGEDISVKDYINAVGQYEGGKINSDGNAAAKAADPNTIYNYQMSSEEEAVINAFETATMDNYLDQIIRTPARSVQKSQSSDDQIISQQINSTQDTGQSQGGLKIEFPELQAAATLSDSDYNAIINSIVK